MPVLPAASLTDGGAAEAVRAAGVCVVHDALSADQLGDIERRLAALTPRKMQNRRPQRWEHVHDPASDAFQQLAALPGVAAVVKALLGPKTYLEKAGMLVAHPGAEAQRWHMDTPHLFASRQHLPPHSISVFVPLCALTELNGPTEFQLSTHIKANLATPPTHADARAPLGSLVIYDIRVMHRGGANRSEADRPVVYLTFSRVWYRDTLNP
jgi:ectoine hydroxylase-related dioxygenase (phytanoyl-CoA dioxygenase family)